MSYPSGAPLNIIRIKRKANEAPLTSLVVEAGESRAPKRTRQNTTTSTRANVAQSAAGSTSSSAAGKGRGVFRLVQTVGSGWKGQGAEGHALQQHIQNLITRAAEPASSSASTSEATGHLESISSAPSSSATTATSSATANEIGAHVQSETAPPNRRYEIIRNVAVEARRIASLGSRNRLMGAKGRRRNGTSKMGDSRDGSPAIRFIDARPEQTSKPETVVQKEDMQSTPAASQTDKDEDEEEGEVKMSDLEKFLPMLKQTAPQRPPQPTAPTPLRPRGPVPIGPPPMTPPLHTLSPAQRSFITSTPPSRKLTPVVRDLDEDGDWVYDLYYQDPEALAGDASPSGASDSTGAEAGGMIGALIGLDDFLDEENDPGSDTEEGDEADEDSNDEDFYRNDYPEDEDAASGDERWATDQRAKNGFIYGDEMDDDRDGFGTDEEPVHPLHKPIGGRPPGLEDSDEDYDEGDYDSDEVPVPRWRPIEDRD